MSTLTITRPAPTPVKAAPLDEHELDSLITLAASTEKPKKVKAGTRRSTEARAWSRGGNVD